MKIVFLSRYQNKVNRGAENFVSEISNRLSEKHEVDILSDEKADSMEIIYKGNYDVVIPINGRLQSLKASFGRMFSKYKLLITGHSGIGRDDLWNIAVVRPDIFIALTNYTAFWAKKWAWGTKIVKIPNGIDLDKFSPDGSKISVNLPKPIILSVGSLVWYKHHERVIKAIDKLGYGSLLIVGEGNKKDELEKMGKNFLGDRFKIMNFKYQDMPKIYRSVNLFSLPSWDREAFGLVYLEALASGLGVIAPDDLSRREIVGDGGIFVNTENIQEYERAIERGLKINWVEKSRQQAKKFSWNEIADKYEKVMQDLIK